MRKIDEIGLTLCKIQAKIFEKSLEKFNGSSAVFIRRFMNSNFAKRMDNDSFIFGSDNIENIFMEIEEEYGKSSYGSLKYHIDEISWIGYLYRYWVYTYETSTREVYNIIKPSELRLLYFPYHSLDPKVAIERILEAKGRTEEDLIARGVQILKEIRSGKIA